MTVVYLLKIGHHTYTNLYACIYINSIHYPSNVDVPLPSSSNITNEEDVASFRMLAVSCSSTMNVDCPPMMLSLAPIRVKIRSMAVNLHELAGT